MDARSPGSLVAESPWLIQQVMLVAVDPAEDARAVGDPEVRLAVFPPRGPLDLASVRLDDELVAVADAEDGDGAREDLLVGVGRTGVVDARRPSREDDALDLHLLQRADGRVEGEERSVDPEAPDPPGDEMRVLSAEIEDGYPATEQVQVLPCALPFSRLGGLPPWLSCWTRASTSHFRVSEWTPSSVCPAEKRNRTRRRSRGR